ncbi:MAG: holo-ACP synthase [Candidatus Calescibacterium sp.]|nr:holo-ACP synthase [Candidatus Calescibacterium sp.]MDW8132342.1 holo-ACP synthase [Candidatus Calescibacterium sp.]
MELRNTENLVITIGTDILKNERIKKNIKNISFIKRILSDKEMQTFKRIKNINRKLEFIAGRFCAKESITKAVKYKLNFNQISINHDSTVELDQVISEKIEKILGTTNFDIQLSISHEREYTISTCLLILKKT